MVGCSNKAGDSGLDALGTESNTEGKNRKNKLINSKTFCTNYAGEEYSIEETDYSAGKSGHSKQESTDNQWI